jgi:D-glycero-D-manno-heptose 1,7-bisphosphate phosphatase
MRAVFLDRDGTVIVDQVYPKAAEQVCLLAGAGEALAMIKESGFALVLISNQSGIGRGLITPKEAEEVHQAVVARLAEYGVQLDGAYYCPHAPEEACTCRKPSPEMLLRAAKELNLDLPESFMVGDNPSDIEAGKRAGCRTILFRTQQPQGARSAERGEHTPLLPPCPQPDEIASDWTDLLRLLRIVRNP